MLSAARGLAQQMLTASISGSSTRQSLTAAACWAATNHFRTKEAVGGTGILENIGRTTPRSTLATVVLPGLGGTSSKTICDAARWTRPRFPRIPAAAAKPFNT